MRIEPGVALALTIGIACASSGRARAVAPAMTSEPAPATVHAAVPEPAPAATIEPPAMPADTFETDVKPLLMRRCAPCHAPGGQMYARMPFDAPATVREHQAGILRRLKADGAPIERWLAADSR